MENSNKKIESPCLIYLDTNNLYGWMSQKLRIVGFKRKKYILKFNEEFIKNCDEDGNKGYILEVDVEYPNDLNDLDNDLPYLPEIMTINKCYKLICNLYDKQDYVVHIRLLTQALNPEIILQEVHTVIQFNQKAWLKEYIDMNNKLRIEAKNDLDKISLN